MTKKFGINEFSDPFDFVKARRKYAANPTLKDRMLQIHEVVTTVSPKYLKKEERVCNICMVSFDGNEQGISRDKK